MFDTCYLLQVNHKSQLRFKVRELIGKGMKMGGLFLWGPSLDNSFKNFISLLVKWIVVTFYANTRLSIYKGVFS